MARVKRSMMKNKRKSKILKLAKGFRNARSTKYKQAKQGVIRAGQHAFAHRRKKKREMRKTWQVKISYAVKDMTGLSYSKFIDVLTKKDVQVDRKIMADMIENDAAAFKRFLESVVTNAGVATFAELAKKSSEDIQTIIADVRGSHDSETWPKQAEMAAAGQWEELKAWQDEMDGGKA